MKINKTQLLGVSITLMMAACSLDYDPIDTYSEKTEGAAAQGAAADTAAELVIFKDKAAADNQRLALYQRMKDAQETWYLDLLLLAEVHADNAYAGATDNQTTPFEVNSIEGSNINLDRDWNNSNGYMNSIAIANKLIAGIDHVPDAALTEAMRKQYKAEALIFRAMMYFDMVRIWGSVPLITGMATTITSVNIDEAYDTYFPPQTDELSVYKQIEADLLAALPDAPNVDNGDKSLLSKALANTLLAKVYAEKPLRNYSKVKEYCDAVTGFTLVNDFGDLFGVVLANSAVAPGADNMAVDAKNRNTPETILEIPFASGSKNWVSWMFGRAMDDWAFYFSFVKWILPSRDLMSAFDAEGDTERKNETIVYDSWEISGYGYPKTHYPFMYKCRSQFNSIIKYRYADVLLLKAEALILGDGDFAGAAAIINQLRTRAGIADISVPASQSDAVNVLLKERRLELAFEGHRWFDLCRLDKVEEVLNSLPTRDPARPALAIPYSANSYKLPIPQNVIDQNPNLEQNPGY
ncbi:membrane protein [Bacteroidia bacterium]|nr:membrane protein [Bacteroidia bacterium]